MALSNMQQRASGTTRFAIVQLIALVGWIIVQSLFSLSPLWPLTPICGYDSGRSDLVDCDPSDYVLSI